MPKKNILSLSVIAISAIVFLAAPLLKANSDPTELNEEFLCDEGNVYTTLYLYAFNSCGAVSLYQVSDDRTFFKNIISYLAKYEKSPPVFIA